MKLGVLGKLGGWFGDGDRNRLKIFFDELGCFVIVRDELRRDDELDVTDDAFDFVDFTELVDLIELGWSSTSALCWMGDDMAVWYELRIRGEP